MVDRIQAVPVDHIGRVALRTAVDRIDQAACRTEADHIGRVALRTAADRTGQAAFRIEVDRIQVHHIGREGRRRVEGTVRTLVHRAERRGP